MGPFEMPEGVIEVASTEGHTQEQLWAAEHRVINTLLPFLVPAP